MRVMMVLCEMVIGGAERMALEVVRALQGRGCEFTVAALRRGGALAEAFGKTGAAVRDGLARRRLDPLGLLRVARLVRRQKIDVVVLVDVPRNGMFYGFVGAALGRRRIPAICWCHSSPGGQSGRFLRQLRLYRKLHLVDSVVCISRLQRRMLVAGGLPRRRMPLIRNGVDLKRFAEGGTSDLPIPAGKRIFVQVANVMPDKDYPTLLEAARLLAAQRDDFHLVMVGRGTDGPDMTSQVAREGLAARVTLAGSRDDVPRILAAADAFVLSTRREVFSVSVLEAMAAGLPLIASDVPAFEEMFTHQREGLKFAPGDARALAEAMGRLMDDDALRGRLAAASAKRGRRFDLRDTARRFLRLLDRTCRQARGAT